MNMEKVVPGDVCIKVFSLLDHHQDLVAAQQVCRRWNVLGSEDDLWCNLFKQRWGIERAMFYAPTPTKSSSWKHVYTVQHRCDRLGLGLKIIREGDDYFLIHQGEIQKHLGSTTTTTTGEGAAAAIMSGRNNDRETGILDRILFFIGDLETASAASPPAKRGRRP